MSNPKPLEISEAQALLAPDEAMLVYLVGGDASWLWALRHERAAFYKLQPGAKTLSTEVAALRERLDPNRNPDFAPFDAQRAHALYQKIIASAAPVLDGAHEVFVVADGALESLPFEVLVTKPPPTDPAHLADHRHGSRLSPGSPGRSTTNSDARTRAEAATRPPPAGRKIG